MKYLSLLVFFFAMQWSWSLIHESSGIEERVHVGIQNELKRIITDYIQETLPNSKGFHFKRFWTESLKKNQVKATFIYSFEDATEETGPARVQVEGYAILNRHSATHEEHDYWNFDELYILNNHVDFKEPIEISTKEDDSN